MKKRMLSIFMVLVMCISLLPTVALATSLEQNLGESSTAKATGTNAASTAKPLSNPKSGVAAYAETETPQYINASGKPENFPDEYTTLTSGTTSLSAGWYVVSENTTIDGKLTIEQGTANLILCDNATLTVTGGVKGEKNAKLHIYAQSKEANAGQMTVTGQATDTATIDMSDSGTLVVNGGVVTATSKKDTGTAYGVSAYKLSVAGGELNATAEKPDGAGTTAACYSGIYIKNYMGVSGGTVNATGGNVTATDNNNNNNEYSSTGITINSGRNDSKLAVAGGTVTAKGGTVAVTTDDSTSDFLASSQGIATKVMPTGQTNATGGNISVVGTGQLNATGGNVTVTKSEGSTGTNLNGGSYGIYQDSSSSDISLPADSNDNGKLTARAGTVTTDGTGTSYDIWTKGNLKVDYSPYGYGVGTVQSDENGSAVKVYVEKNLTAKGTIRLAEGSKICTSISADSNAKFNVLLDSGCCYVHANNTQFALNNIQEQTSNGVTTYTMSAESNDYILIEKSSSASPVPYLNENGTTSSCVFYEKLTGETTGKTISDSGWYVVSENTTINGTLTIAGNAEVHLILCDNATLTVTGGVEGKENAKLYIYAQSKEDTESTKVGKMTVTGNLLISDEAYAIYMDDTLAINSGVVTAEATGTNAPNVGICTYTLTVNGGEVNATSGNTNYSYGIYIKNNLTVNGGKVTAKGGDVENANSHGLRFSSNASLSMTGGEVTATGGKASSSYGIYTQDNYITVKGGTLNATGGKASSSYGIYMGDSNKVSVTGGTLNATGGEARSSYGIYMYNSSGSIEVSVTGGTLNATGGVANSSNAGSSNYGSYGIYMSASVEMTVSGQGQLIAKASAANVANEENETTSSKTGKWYSVGIYSNNKNTSSITVKDDGKLTATGNTANSGQRAYSYGISCNGMTVDGNGTVKAEAGAATQESFGLNIDGTNGTLAVKSGELTATGGTAPFSCGIYFVEGALTVDSGNLTATGGTATDTSCGIRMQNPCNTTVTGGTLKATGGTVDVAGTETDVSYGSYGINTNSGGKMTVSGQGKLIAEAGTVTSSNMIAAHSIGIYHSGDVSSPNIEVKDRGELTATGNTVTSGGLATSSGIQLEGYTITVQDSAKLTATAGTSTGTYGSESYGISCQDMTIGGNGNVTAKSSTATAEYNAAESYDINGKVTVSGGTVQSDTTGAAVKVQCSELRAYGGTMTLASGSKITTALYAKSTDAINALRATGCRYFSEDGTSATVLRDSDVTSTTDGSTAVSKLSPLTGQYILVREPKPGEIPTVSYLDENGDTAARECDGTLTSATRSLGSGWYAVEGATTINGTLTIAKDAEVHLILCDNATLTVTGGVKGEENAKLHIYAQTLDNNTAGQMNVTGAITTPKDGAAGIYMNTGTLVVNGGVVTARSADSEAKYENIGIYTDVLTVNNGTLNATGGKLKNEVTEIAPAGAWNCGINVQKDMTVNGGTVNATGGVAKAAQVDADTMGYTGYTGYSIGLGILGDLTINGGTVNAVANNVDATMRYITPDSDPYAPEYWAFSHGVRAHCENGTICNITIQDGGTLNATGGAVNGTITGADNEEDETGYLVNSYGVYMNYYLDASMQIRSGKVTVQNGGTLKATGGAVDVGTVTGNGLFYGYSHGICLEGGSIKVTDGTVITEAGTATSAGKAESIGIYAYEFLNVEGRSTFTATGKNSTAAADSESYGISCGIATVAEDGNSAVKATSGNATLTDDADNTDNICCSNGVYVSELIVRSGTVTAKGGNAVDSYDIYGNVSIEGGKVQSNDTGAAVRVWADSETFFNEAENKYDTEVYSVSISGGTIKLAENSLLKTLTATQGVTLRGLLDEGCAYQKTADNTFVTLADQDQLTDVTIKPCTHSAAYGTCDYCGKNLGSAPSGGGGGGGGGGSAPSTPSTSITVPVTSDTASVEVKADVSKDGTATVEVSDKQIEEVATNGSGTVTVDVSGVKNVESVQVPSHVVETTNQAEETGLTVSMPTGSVALDETALNSVSTGEDVTVSVKRVPATDLNEAQQAAVGDMANIGIVVDVDVFVGSEKQSTFNGGKLTISVPYTPKKNEDPSKMTVWYIKDDGTIQPMGGSYDAEKKCFVFETTHLSRYVIVSVEDMPTFTDVPADAYYADAVAWAVLNGITTGMTETTFGPDLSCTRAQIVTFLWRAAGQPEVTGSNPFSDVNESDYFYQAVLWAVENKITTGTTETTFSPEDTCTRAQAAAFIYRNEQANGGGFADAWAFQLPFTDVPAWCYEAVAWCYVNDITKGTSETTFSPDLDCTRAQIVTMLYRAS